MVGRKMCDMEMPVMMVLVLGLLAMVQPSMQVSLKNPLHLLPRNVRSDEPSAIGLITTSYLAEKALNESGQFTPTSYIDLFGRRFVIATIFNFPVIYVRTPSNPSIHAGITVQLLADHFNVGGIVHFGSAGATNQSLSIGTVSIPVNVGFLGAWDWLSKDSNEKGQLIFGEFNYPKNGGNLLGSIEFKKIDILYKGDSYANYWIYASASYIQYACRIQIDSGDVVVGLNSSSSDIYIQNSAYGNFLYETFKVSTVETAGAGIGLGAKSNGLPFISFQGISNKVGDGDAGESARELAATNVVKAVINFIWQAFVLRHPQDQ